MDRKQIKLEAKLAIKDHWIMLFVVLFVIGAITGASAVALIGFLLAPILTAGVFKLTKLMLDENKFDFNVVLDYFKDLNHALKIVGTAIIVQIIVMIGIFLFIIPGIIFALQYSQAVYIMAQNPEIGIEEALSRSKEMMKGHKTELLVFYLSFILHFLLVIITFGIYTIYLAPYIVTSLTNFYLHLSGQKKVIRAEVEYEF